ncbi:MAG: acyltransferase [Deltaproteobacteria bacterium]
MNTILLDAFLGACAIGGSAAVAIAIEAWARARLEMLTGAFYSIIAVVTGLILFGLIAALLLRLLRGASPLSEGEHDRPSRAFTRWKLDFNLQESAYRTLGFFVPVFGRAWLFRLLGARIASPVVVAGTLTDPAVTRIGRRTIVGGGAFITCHVITDGRFSLQPVTLGSGVTIGGGALVMAGVEIGDGAVVSPGSVVLPGTRIPPYELWAGNPARKVSSLRSAG